jgi:hypothetical protein
MSNAGLTTYSSADNILDDLQHSISRPGSSLGQPMTNYSSHRDVQYIQPANATTVLRERSLSPNSNVRWNLNPDRHIAIVAEAAP